jgi:energy-coupling factor transporter ATP-binding protein EcfA2
VRIAAIRLSWFRGAATNDELKAEGKSVATYGSNGSGKSSFVDGLECVISGKVQHLAHEYSGKNQEKGLVNTHRQSNENAAVEVLFDDGTSVVRAIRSNGSQQLDGTGLPHLKGWDYRKTVLRQDEVAEFVRSTKGQKYSVLLPLLGLAHLETAAENVRHLAGAVLKQSGISEAKDEQKRAWEAIADAYGTSSIGSLNAAIEQLCAAYVEATHEHSNEECLQHLEMSLSRRLNDADALQRLQIGIDDLAKSDIRAAIASTREAAEALAKEAASVLSGQLDVLRAMQKFLSDPLSAVDECPACGSRLPQELMRKHVVTELARLKGAMQKQKEWEAARTVAVRSAQHVVELCRRKEIQEWATSHSDARLHPFISAAAAVDAGSEPSEAVLIEWSKTLGEAVTAAASVSAFHPPPANELANAQVRIVAIKRALAADAAVANSSMGDALADFLKQLERGIRQQIHDKSRKVVNEISTDVQRMWAILHPGDPIAEIRLHIPDDADKAIDIALQFHGKALESPRLTLSEGYRNSLGLCVFLAMAARDKSLRPIILDDVIVSLDRAHRGFVVKLLQAEFPDRQVLLFTHDRDWFAELRLRLDQKHWQFRSLLPYGEPRDGIRWSARIGNFDDAKKYLDTRPDIAANEVRKIMDTELSLHVEALELRLRYARGEKNDKRMAAEFLERLIGDGKKHFQVRDGTTYGKNDDAVSAFESASKLLTSWGNRGSHTEDVVKAEAEELMQVCQSVIDALRCSGCGKFVHANLGNDGYQCRCGALRWRH